MKCWVHFKKIERYEWRSVMPLIVLLFFIRLKGNSLNVFVTLSKLKDLTIVYDIKWECVDRYFVVLSSHNFISNHFCGNWETDIDKTIIYWDLVNVILNFENQSMSSTITRNMSSDCGRTQQHWSRQWNVVDNSSPTNVTSNSGLLAPFWNGNHHSKLLLASVSSEALLNM